MATKAFIAIVHGMVQGVGFRYHTRKTASALGMTGTVRNLRSGEVEIIAEGSETALEQLADWLHRGPALSRVSRVDLTWTPPKGNFDGFRIIG